MSLLLAVRALYVFHFRVHQIRTLGDGAFYDLYTPLALVSVLAVGVVASAFFGNATSPFILSII